jgi:diguanylate cyclase (GGDEF)-like protein
VQYNVILINDNPDELQNLTKYFHKIHDVNLLVVETQKDFEYTVLKNSVHLILANEKCIDVDPLTICQYIRSLEKLNFLPFIYLMKDDDIKHIQHAYSIGVDECVKAPFSLDELFARVHRHMLNYEALKNCLGQKERLAIVLATDQLTKVSNRMHLQTLLRQAIREHKRYQSDFSIIYFQIHDMPKINKMFGFSKGDRLLRDIAQFVSQQIRKCDVIARWGGGDFIILAPKTKADDAQVLAAKLNKALKQKTFLDSFKITINFGVTGVSKEDDVNTIIERARKALQLSVNDTTRNIIKL